MTLIDGDRIITAKLYDDEHEEFIEKKMSIIDCLNAYTDEGVTEADVVEQQACDDCISRQAVLDAINTYDKFGYTETGCFVREPEGDYISYIHYDDVIKCVKNASPVTPKEKTGKWIDSKDWKRKRF